MEPIRIGFVGLGGICRSRHVPGLRRIEAVEITAVANRSRESGERAAQEFGIQSVCDTWQELVARDDVDAVFIGTWPYLHKPVTLAALDAGKHVFCQARMAMDYAEARAMYERAKGSGLVTMLCPVPIGLSVDATIARLLRENVVGEVRLVRVQGFSDAYADPAAPMNWRKDHRLSGLNMGTLGMYIEVIHRWFGWTQSVAAHTDTFVPERVDPTGGHLAVEIPDQILFHATMVSGFPVQYVVSTTVLHGFDVIEIYGTNTTLRYDVGQDRLYDLAYPDAPVMIKPEDACDLANWRVEEDFINAIRTGSDYHPNFEDGMRYMQVVQAVYDSAEQQRTIETP